MYAPIWLLRDWNVCWKLCTYYSASHLSPTIYRIDRQDQINFAILGFGFRFYSRFRVRRPKSPDSPQFCFLNSCLTHHLSLFFILTVLYYSRKVLYQWATKRGMQQNVVDPESKSHTFHAGFQALDWVVLRKWATVWAVLGICYGQYTSDVRSKRLLQNSNFAKRTLTFADSLCNACTRC